MCIEISHIIMGSVCIKVALNFIFLNECRYFCRSLQIIKSMFCIENCFIKSSLPFKCKLISNIYFFI